MMVILTIITLRHPPGEKPNMEIMIKLEMRMVVILTMITPWPRTPSKQSPRGIMWSAIPLLFFITLYLPYGSCQQGIGPDRERSSVESREFTYVGPSSHPPVCGLPSGLCGSQALLGRPEAWLK